MADESSSSESPKPPKRKAGNPNFGKQKRNPYYDKPKDAPPNPGDPQKNIPPPPKDSTNQETSTNTQSKMTDENKPNPPIDPPPTPPTPPEPSNGGAQGPPPPPPVVNAADAPTENPIDLFSDDMPVSEDLPLDGEVVQKAYGSLNENGANGNSGNPPPPNTPPKPGDPPPPVGDPSSPSTTPAGPPKTPAEVQSEAEQLVKMLLKGYDKLHGLGRWAGKVDEGKLAQEHLAGKLNLQQELPIGKNTVTVAQFFNEYNMGIDENIVVTEEFKTTITPPLVRIAIKRGWGVGDELFVALTVSEDLATKASMLIGLKKSANMVLEACHALMKKQTEDKKEPAPDAADEPGSDTPYEDIPNDQNENWNDPENQ